MDWAEVRARVQAIAGMISDSEGRYLYMLAKRCGGNIVEIGSWEGMSTVYLALGSKAGGGGRVFAIDPHGGTSGCHEAYGVEDTEPIFRENIKRAGVDDIATPLVMKSEEAAEGWTKEPISLLWIDGAHDYENVKKDFLLWEPYLKENGVIAFHDALYTLGYNYPGIRKVMCKYIFQSNRFSKVHFCGSIVCATKVAKLSAKDRVVKLQKLPLFFAFPFIYSVFNFMNPILAKIGLVAPARVIKDKILALIQ